MGASRMTWVDVTSFDGLGQPRTIALSGGSWSTALVPLAVLLLATAVAALAVRGWPLRALAVLAAIASAGMAYLAISLWLVRDVGVRASALADAPVADLVGTQRHYGVRWSRRWQRSSHSCVPCCCCARRPGTSRVWLATHAVRLFRRTNRTTRCRSDSCGKRSTKAATRPTRARAVTPEGVATRYPSIEICGHHPRGINSHEFGNRARHHH